MDIKRGSYLDGKRLSKRVGQVKLVLVAFIDCVVGECRLLRRLTPCD
jgi:hypothetical protein